MARTIFVAGEPFAEACREANDGTEAVKLAGKLCPDLLVLDVAMPVMTGLQAVPVLRELVPHSPISLQSPGRQGG